MEPFLGCWKYESHKNFDKFLNQVGVPSWIAKIAVMLPAWQTFSKGKQEGDYKTELSTLTKKTGGTFKVGEEFQETTMNGGLMTSKIWFEDGKMKQVQDTPKGRVETTRQIDGDKLVVEYLFNGQLSSQNYKRCN